MRSRSWGQQSPCCSGRQSKWCFQVTSSTSQWTSAERRILALLAAQRTGRAPRTGDRDTRTGWCGCAYQHGSLRPQETLPLARVVVSRSTGGPSPPSHPGRRLRPGGPTLSRQTGAPPDTYSQPTRARFLVLAFLCALTFVLYLDRVCISQALNPIQKELGLSNTEMGYVLMAFTLAYGLCEVPTGHWGDRIGARAVLTRIRRLVVAVHRPDGRLHRARFAPGRPLPLRRRRGRGTAQRWPASSPLVPLSSVAGFRGWCKTADGARRDGRPERGRHHHPRAQLAWGVRPLRDRWRGLGRLLSGAWFAMTPRSAPGRQTPRSSILDRHAGAGGTRTARASPGRLP